MKIKATLLILLVSLGVVFYFRNNLSGIKTAVFPSNINVVSEIKKGVNSTDFPINIPDGYVLEIYNDNLTAPRVLALDPKNKLVVSDIKENTVYFINNNSKSMLVSGLNSPHGIAFSCDTKDCLLFIADRSGVYKFDYNKETSIASNKKTILNLNSDGRHFTKTLLVKEDKLYISVGSSCDTCVEKDPRRGTVLVTDFDGADTRIFSYGLRNSVFMRLHPGSGEIWATEMGRDFLGDNLPPDEINILKAEQFYGWPYCYGNQIQDIKFSTTSDCSDSVPSHYDLQAHSAPLGLEFLDKNTMLVSYHGSWNRTEPTGYKIVKMTLNNSGEVIKEEDFLTGWLKDGQSLGRPVDILKSGEDIFITDDKAGVIYKLSKI